MTLGLLGQLVSGDTLWRLYLETLRIFAGCPTLLHATLDAHSCVSKGQSPCFIEPVTRDGLSCTSVLCCMLSKCSVLNGRKMGNFIGHSWFT